MMLVPSQTLHLPRVSPGLACKQLSPRPQCAVDPTVAAAPDPWGITKKQLIEGGKASQPLCWSYFPLSPAQPVNITVPPRAQDAFRLGAELCSLCGRPLPSGHEHPGHWTEGCGPSARRYVMEMLQAPGPASRLEGEYRRKAARRSARQRAQGAQSPCGLQRGCHSFVFLDLGSKGRGQRWVAQTTRSPWW